MSQMTTLHLMVAWNDSLRQNDDAQMTQSSFLVHRLPLTAHLFMHWVPGSTKQFHLLTDCGYIDQREYKKRTYENCSGHYYMGGPILLSKGRSVYFT